MVEGETYEKTQKVSQGQHIRIIHQLRIDVMVCIAYFSVDTKFVVF
jgi:hypothetical protein